MKEEYDDVLDYLKDLIDEGLWDGQFYIDIRSEEEKANE